MDLDQTIRRILREESEEYRKVLKFPSLSFFGDDPQRAWDTMQKILKSKGNPPYSVKGDLYLYNIQIESLRNLQSIGGSLNLNATGIKSLGNLQSVGGYLSLQFNSKVETLGNLESVGEHLYLDYSNIESLGNLKYVGRDLDFRRTPLSEMYTEKQIREMVNVGGDIFL